MMLMTANRPLPDVAFEPAALSRALDWVGMEGIALPIRLNDRGLQAPAKVDVGVARGKKLYDKRQTVAERDAKRSMEQAAKERSRW